jgi:hypothetical protein
MHSNREEYLHKLSTSTIARILRADVWRIEQQSITSAVTNDNNLQQADEHYTNSGENTSGINAFADIQFSKSVKRMIDVGGGQYDHNKYYMQKNRGIQLLVWDPFNRTNDHNNTIQSEVADHKVDAATSMSVLNVIPELSVRLTHINTLKSALTINGKAYFKIWPGEEPLLGSYLPSETSEYYQANSGAERFLHEIEAVFGTGNVEISSKIANLIIAVKSTEAHNSDQDIMKAQANSLNSMQSIIQHQQSRLHTFQRREINLLKINFRLFKHIEKTFIQDNRHTSLDAQHEYDKRYGLTISGH